MHLKEESLREVLVEALQHEARLCKQLRIGFESQQDAVAAGDPDGLADAVFATTRITQTLEEAKRQRQSLTSSLFGADLDFDDLNDAMSEDVNRPVRKAFLVAAESASRLQREVRVLRASLQITMADNQRHLELLLGRAGADDLSMGLKASGSVVDRVG
jgi:hypothetical protein